MNRGRKRIVVGRLVTAAFIVYAILILSGVYIGAKKARVLDQECIRPMVQQGRTLEDAQYLCKGQE